MPKSSKENSAVPRVTRSLRNRVVSVENETPDRITPTVKKDLEPISENDNKDKKSTPQTTTPARGRPRRSSQSEAISTPVKTPARRLTRRTSLSELDTATISSPMRRITRKISTLVENVLYVEDSEEEKEIIMEKKATRSSKSPNSLSNKIKTATENVSTKKGISKGKKSRSPSPLTIQEENDKQINKTQSAGTDNKHTSSVLPTVREDMEEISQSQNSIPKTSNEVVKDVEVEKEIIMEKRTTRSSSNSPNTIAKENIDAKKGGSRLKLLSSPSPKKSSNTTQENNDNDNNNEKLSSQSSGDTEKDQNSTVLSTACEEPQKPQNSSTVDLVKESTEKEIIIEKQLTGSTLKATSGLLNINKTAPDTGKTKKGKKSRSPSPFNISTAKEDNENQVGEKQSSGKSDTNCNSTVLSAVLEDPKKVQQSSQSFCKSPLPNLLADKENEKEPAPNTTQSSSSSKLVVEIADAQSNTLPMKSPNPTEKVQEVTSPFKRVTRSTSKSPVVLEKETRKEKLSKKNIIDPIAETSEDNQVIDELQKKMKMSKETKKVELSGIKIKDTEITKTTMNVEPIKETKNTTETAESPKEIAAVEIKEPGITKIDIPGEANEVNKAIGSKVVVANTSTLAEATQKSEKGENDLISLETNSGLKKPTKEVLNMEEKEQLLHHSLCEDFNDSSIIKADMSINEIIAKCSDDKTEEEKENLKPEKNHEINISNTNLYKSTDNTSNTEHVDNKSNKSENEDPKFEESNKDSLKNTEERILDKSLGTSSAKDISSTKHLHGESEIREAPIKEHAEVIGDVSSKNENVVLDRSLEKSVEHLPNEESISSFSKSSQVTNINDETFDESMLSKTDLLKEKERRVKRPIEDQTEAIKKQKSVVFDTTEDSEKASVNYPKTPICSKSKSYVADEEPNSFVDTSNIQKLTSKRAIVLDDSKEPEEECAVETVEGESNEVAKPNTPLKNIKTATILSSTPIIDSKQPNVADCGLLDRKKNTSLPHGDNNKDDKHGFSKSWSQAIIGKAKEGESGTAFIDALEHEKKKERDAILMAQIKKSQKDLKRKEPNSSEDEDDVEEDQEKNEFLDDEAMEVKEGEESMDSEERRYLEENEVPEHGESIGSEDTDQEDEEGDESDDCGEENSIDSFIVSEADENHELLSVDSAEFSSDESTDEEKQVTKKRSFNTSRRIESSDESDQDDDINLKTKKTIKLVIESSDEESKDHNESLETEGEMRNEDINIDKYREQKEEENTSKAIELDASSTQQDNEDVSISCSKIEKKQQMPEEHEKANKSVISVNSSYMESSIKEGTDTQKEGASSSTAVDKSKKNYILEDTDTVKEISAKMKSESNHDEGKAREREFKKEIPPISSKEIKRRSSLKTMPANNTELTNLKETGGNVVRNLNSSEETLSATEKTIHSKSVHEDETNRVNTTNEDPILMKESDKELLLEDPSDEANIKDGDEDESKISVEPDIEPLEDLHKTKKGKIKDLKKRVFSASFTVAENESFKVEKMNLSFTSVPKKSKKIKENKETNQSAKKILQDDGGEEVLQENEDEKEVLQDDEVLYGSSNLEEQSSSTNSSELHLGKIFTDISQYNEVPKGKEKDKKTKTTKKSKGIQKSTNEYNPDMQENVEELSFEKRYEEEAEISYTNSFPDCSTNPAKEIEAKTKSSSDAKDTRDLSPILQVLNKSEARLETLIIMKQSINRKIKKMNMKLQQLYGNNSPKSNELLDDYETAIAVALKHGLCLLGKQKRKVSRKLQKMNYMPSESEFSSEEAHAQEEQEPQKRKRKEKVVYTDNTELIPSQKTEKSSTSSPKKRKRENSKTLAKTHEQSHAAYRKSLNFVKTTSGLFVEEPNSPEIQKTKKFRITSTFELPFGVVFEEAVTPTKKVVNGFQVTQATPRAIGFKVESILSAGQKEAPSVKKSGIKRKLDLSESTQVLPKPKWGNAGNFSVKKLRAGSSGYIPLNLNESASTDFIVAPLKSKKASSQAGPSTMKAMEFKERALSNKHIQRESSHNILQRKQKKKANLL